MNLLETGSTAPQGFSRELTLDGGINFRDLGGYKTLDGRQLQWRRLFRCGHLRDLSDQDEADLKALGLTHIHDFRREEERSRMVNRELPVTVYNDYNINIGSLPRFWQMLRAGELSDQVSHSLVVGAYADCLEEVTPLYQRFFERLVDNLSTPSSSALFHCTAGKDRTGLAAALILAALKVPRETIVQDYMLTLEYYDVDSLITLVEGHLIDDEENTGVKNHWQRSWLEPYCSVHTDNIHAFFNAVDTGYGDMPGFLKQGLGLGDDALALLRARLLA